MSSDVAIPHVAKRPLRRRYHIAVRLAGYLVLLNLAWRCVRYALGFPFWGDEGFVVVNFLVRDFAGLFKPLEYGQIDPLLFMWAELAVSRVLGLSERALRLVPFVSGVLAVLLYWRFATRTLGRWEALMAVGILAAAYYPVRHALEVKPYGVDMLMSLVLITLGWSVLQRPRCDRRWALLIAAAVVGVWASYPSVFIAGGVGIVLGWKLVREPSGRLAAGWIALGVGLAVSFGAMFLLYGKPHADARWLPGAAETMEQWGDGFPPVADPWRIPLWLVRVHTGFLMAYPVGGRDGGSTATFLFACVGALVLWQRQRWLLGLLLSPIPLAMVAAAMQRYPYGGSARYSQHLAPAVCLLAGVGLLTVLKTCLPRRLVPGAIGAMVVIFGLIAIGGIVRDIVQPYKTFADRENKRVVQWLAERTEPTDQWVAFNALSEKVAYADYLGMRSGYGARHRFYLHVFAPCPLTWAPDAATVANPPGGRTWLIVYKDDREPFPEEKLQRYLAVLTGRVGEPTMHEFVLHGSRNQTIVIYEFPRSA